MKRSPTIIDFYHMGMPASSKHSIELPGSKSIAARALILQFIYEYKFGLDIKLEGLPDCDDTRELNEALSQLRQYVSASHGAGSIGAEARFNLGNGGTSCRFFIALVASIPGFRGVVDCGAAMRRRPIAPMVEALRRIGGRIDYQEQEGRIPLYVEGRVLNGGVVEVDSSVSSQYISALMMASLLWSGGRVELRSEVSKPYVEMTRSMMENFARVEAELRNPTASRGLGGTEREASMGGTEGEASMGVTEGEASMGVKEGEISKGGRERECLEYRIERDWSAASYFYEWALLHRGVKLKLPGLLPPYSSLQGDSGVAGLFAQLGVETRYYEGEADEPGGIEIEGSLTREVMAGKELKVNLQDMPDLTPALVAGCCCAGVRFEIAGIAHIRVKESDRVGALIEEMGKMGYLLEWNGEVLSWTGTRKGKEACGDESQLEANYDSHGDHRIAMALMAAGVDKTRIKGWECVRKSFPGYDRVEAELRNQTASR